MDQEQIHSKCYSYDPKERGDAIKELCKNYKYLSNKEKAWEDLYILTSDQNRDVRVNAYESLGRISIYKASKSESVEQYLEELKKAIDFFEQTTKESTLDNSSKFCFLLYRSFYTIISAKKQEETEDEVTKYLSEAKNEIGKSKDKKLLFNAVENLANALKEVQNLENLDLDAKKSELNLYRKYCEQAVELMLETEQTVPFTTIVMRKGLPILDRNLKSLIEEIQEKAKIACQKSQGTGTAEIACVVNEEVPKWIISNQKNLTFNIENLIFSLYSKIPIEPKNNPIFDSIRKIRTEKDIVKQYQIISSIIPLIPTVISQISSPESNLITIKEQARLLRQETKGTSAEKIASEFSEKIQKWKISDPEKMEQYLKDIACYLEQKITNVPKNKYLLSKIKLLTHEKDLTKQYEILLFVIGAIPTIEYEEKSNMDTIIESVQNPIAIAGFLGGCSYAICEIFKIVIFKNYIFLVITLISLLVTYKYKKK